MKQIVLFFSQATLNPANPLYNCLKKILQKETLLTHHREDGNPMTVLEELWDKEIQPIVIIDKESLTFAEAENAATLTKAMFPDAPTVIFATNLDAGDMYECFARNRTGRPTVECFLSSTLPDFFSNPGKDAKTIKIVEYPFLKSAG